MKGWGVVACLVLAACGGRAQSGVDSAQGGGGARGDAGGATRGGATASSKGACVPLGTEVSEPELEQRVASKLGILLPVGVLDGATNDGFVRAQRAVDAVEAALQTDAPGPARQLLRDLAGHLFLENPNAGAALQRPKALTEMVAREMDTEFESAVDHWLNARATLTELLTDDHAYVNSDLRDHYGYVTALQKEWEPVPLPTAQRAGMLTLGAFLSRFPSPPARGIKLVQALTCSAPPPAPPGPNSVWTEPRLEPAKQIITTQYGDEQSVCGACHQFYVGYAIGLDQYDGVGRYRESIGKTGIDVSSSLVTPILPPLPAQDTPERLDFSSPQEMGRALSASRNVRACMVLTLAQRLGARTPSAAELECLLTRLDRSGSSFWSLMAELSPLIDN